jgi:hypothetical protein
LGRQKTQEVRDKGSWVSLKTQEVHRTSLQ